MAANIPPENINHFAKFVQLKSENVALKVCFSFLIFYIRIFYDIDDAPQATGISPLGCMLVITVELNSVETSLNISVMIILKYSSVC